MVIGSALAVQVNSSTEIYSFNVTNPLANVSSLGCAAAVIHYSVTISNYIYIDQVYFTIGGVDYLASSSGSNFYYDYFKAQNLFDINTTLVWSRIKIYDLSSGIAQAFINLNIPINCVSCHYTQITGSCGLNDSQIIQFIGSGSPGCDNFNISQSCNYCSQNIVTTIVSPCNGTERIESYSDSNFGTCCGVTGLLSDCGILYAPYNETRTLSCSYFSGDFTLQCDPRPIITDRINCLINIGDNGTYACWSYISQSGINGSEGNYLQVNPSMTEYQGTTIIPKLSESRNYFDITRGVGNIYYTRKSLVADTSYLLGIKCVDADGNIKMSDQIIRPVYEDMNSIAARGVWAKSNVGAIIIILLSILVAGGIIMGLIIMLRGEGR
jgi:hypothetical protein